MKRLRRAHQKRVQKSSKPRQRSWARGAIAAGTVAAITFGMAGLNKALAGHSTGQHQLIVGGDSDADQLADVEEFAIGYRPFNSNQNRNEIPDGVELAKRAAAAIEDLPSYVPGTLMPIPNSTYKIQHLLFGIEHCDICGLQVNMGGYQIINPNLDLSYPDPNDPLEGAFLQIPIEPNEHRLALEGSDYDGDLITDNEELAAGYNLYNADQDEDLVPDGIELAIQCAEIIDALPIQDPNGPEILHALYKKSFLQRGLENCEICGTTVNMGYWQITNSTLGLSMEVSEIELHYMQHGSFSFAGDVHGKGRIDLALLAKILEMPRRCGDLGTIYQPADTNRDCQVNLADLTELLDMWLEYSDMY